MVSDFVYVSNAIYDYRLSAYDGQKVDILETLGKNEFNETEYVIQCQDGNILTVMESQLSVVPFGWMF